MAEKYRSPYKGLGAEFQFANRLKAVYKDIRENMRGEISACGGDAVAIARKLIAPHRKTGLYEATIRTDKGEFGQTVLGTVMRSGGGSREGAAAPLEFGRKRTKPSKPIPHMLAAARWAKKNAVEAIGRKGLV